MTIDQIILYSQKMAVIDKQRLRDATIASLAGARYDKDGLDKLFRQLEK